MSNLILLSVQIFENPVALTYNKEDATIEILIMILGSFLFGFFLRQFIGFFRKKEIIMENSTQSEGDKYALAMGEGSGTFKDLDTQIAALRQEIDRISSMKLCNCSSMNKDSIHTNLVHSPAIDSVKSENENNQSPIKEEPKILSSIDKQEAEKGNLKPEKKEKAIVSNSNDLKIIEGIGPAIEKLLNNNGIFTYENLANASISSLEKILDEAGPRFRVHVPETWPEQAKLLFENRMDEFKVLTENLKGGRRV